MFDRCSRRLLTRLVSMREGECGVYIGMKLPFRVDLLESCS